MPANQPGGQQGQPRQQVPVVAYRNARLVWTNPATGESRIKVDIMLGPNAYQGEVSYEINDQGAQVTTITNGRLAVTYIVPSGQTKIVFDVQAKGRSNQIFEILVVRPTPATSVAPIIPRQVELFCTPVGKDQYDLAIEVEDGNVRAVPNCDVFIKILTREGNEILRDHRKTDAQGVVELGVWSVPADSYMDAVVSSALSLRQTFLPGPSEATQAPIVVPAGQRTAKEHVKVFFAELQSWWELVNNWVLFAYMVVMLVMFCLSGVTTYRWLMYGPAYHNSAVAKRSEAIRQAERYDAKVPSTQELYQQFPDEEYSIGAALNSWFWPIFTLLLLPVVGLACLYDELVTITKAGREFLARQAEKWSGRRLLHYTVKIRERDGGGWIKELAVNGREVLRSTGQTFASFFRQSRPGFAQNLGFALTAEGITDLLGAIFRRGFTPWR